MLRCSSFWKKSKQCHENAFLLAKIILKHCFTHFSKTTAPQQVIFSGKLSAIIIFKLCKFSVYLMTLCFLSNKKYIDPLSVYSDAVVSTRAILEMWWKFSLSTCRWDQERCKMLSWRGLHSMSFQFLDIWRFGHQLL